MFLASQVINFGGCFFSGGPFTTTFHFARKHNKRLRLAKKVCPGSKQCFSQFAKPNIARLASKKNRVSTSSYRYLEQSNLYGRMYMSFDSGIAAMMIPHMSSSIMPQKTCGSNFARYSRVRKPRTWPCAWRFMN